MFSKKPEAPFAAGSPDPMSGATFSVLGADLAIKGDLTATADLHVDGTVEGDITCAALVQGASSLIGGAIRAENARLAGTVRGSIQAGSLVILKTARIEGDVSYETLTIEQGARVEGKLSPKPAAEPKLAIAGGREA
ncbi:polymer-forming cytoskeletal protein [Novosphingobium piscinae]|uniref:Polymer-forming cytoskeletal protein n=1 Tax=Novosphingobium piscinae TaxID=1507448 RepID=A0A7X1KRR2_9SPHN|nr:polymer-forming cytoskeletal protein [Novosphingobium piscinae]MBC2670875.1 polymer-forming cytoskeletal protein [Novosphingobium piscinae]